MYREFTEFQWAMLRLDVALTASVDVERVANTIRDNGAASAEAWLEKGGEWYLSDGGYSRVVYGEERGKLFLTSNSTDKAKARWNDLTVRGLAIYVERLMREAHGRLLSRGGA